MNTKKKMGIAELRVGVLVVTSIIVMILMILYASGEITIFTDRMTLRTRLPEVDGLKEGNQVRLAGVAIGKVKKVIFSSELPRDEEAKADTVEVVMEVKGDVARQRIRSDSRVVLGSIGLLGDKVLDITPGTQKGQPVSDGTFIPGAQETSVRELITGADEILANFTTLSNLLKNIAEQIQQGKGTIGKLLTDEQVYQNVNRTVVEAQEMVRRIREGQGSFGKFINDPKVYEDVQRVTAQAAQVMDDIQAGRGTIGKLVKSEEVYAKVNDIAAKLDRVSDRLDRISAQVEKGEGSLGRFVKDDKIARETEQAMTNINRITAKLDKGEGTAGRLLHDDHLYNNLNAASSEIVKLLYDFRQNPKKYLSIKVRLF